MVPSIVPAVLSLFEFTLLPGASLIFFVEPMFAKMVLPLLGGSPAVWNTCVVYFQAALLAGYLYAHLVTTRLSSERLLMARAGVLQSAEIRFALGHSRKGSTSLDGRLFRHSKRAQIAGFGLQEESLASPVQPTC
jgi:hypothetical protein